MSDASSFDFSKFVPGFDFLQKLSGSGSGSGTPAGVPSASSWIAPTLDPEELDKRIQELKTVHFWLDQNTKAVSATIQALEVQKMTLATLRGMNMSMSELAESLKIQPDTLASVFTRPDASTPTAAQTAASPNTAPPPSTRASSAAKPRAAKKSRDAASTDKRPPTPDNATPSGAVDPMAWWGSLTQQFQHIANQALQDLHRHPSATANPDAPAPPAGHRGPTQGSSKAASKASQPARKSGRSTPPSHDT